MATTRNHQLGRGTVRTVLGVLLGLVVVLSPLVCMTEATPSRAAAQATVQEADDPGSRGDEAPCSKKAVGEMQAGARADMPAAALPSPNRIAANALPAPVADERPPVTACGPAPPPELTVLRI